MGSRYNIYGLGKLKLRLDPHVPLNTTVAFHNPGSSTVNDIHETTIQQLFDTNNGQAYWGTSCGSVMNHTIEINNRP